MHNKLFLNFVNQNYQNSGAFKCFLFYLEMILKCTNFNTILYKIREQLFNPNYSTFYGNFHY